MNAWIFMAYAVMGLGCLLVVIGLMGRRNWNRKLEKERARATGVVSGYAQKTSGHRGSPVCEPIISFMADGVERKANWNAIVPLSQWPIGREVELLYDPDHPEDIHLAEQESDSPPNGIMRGGTILIAIALVAIVGLRLLSGSGLIGSKPARNDSLPRISVFTGDPERAKAGFSYTLNQDGSATITGYTGSEAEVVVPMIVDGQLVTSVSRAAFLGSRTLEALTLSNTVRAVPMAMCGGCLRLKTVRLSEGTERVERQAFTGCPSLEDVFLPESLAEIADDAFPEDCGATFHVARGSAAAEWCSARGYKTEY